MCINDWKEKIIRPIVDLVYLVIFDFAVQH